MPPRKKARKQKKQSKSNKSRNIKNSKSQDVENLDSKLFREYYTAIAHIILAKTVQTDANGKVTVVETDDTQKEFETVYETFKMDLPLTFRINPVHEKRVQDLRRQLEQYGDDIDKAQIKKGDFFRDMDQKRIGHLETQLKEKLQKPESDRSENDVAAIENYQNGLKLIHSREYDDSFLPRPKPIEWFPQKLGYYMPISKRYLSKCQDLSNLKTFLLAQTESGNISRQEMVSMLPTQFFNYEPHHKILDMCAAPGSKTAQLLEGLHQAGREQNKPVTGFVVANDNNVKRCHLLVKQLQRLGPLFANMIITSHDATKFPSLKHNGEQIKFDSILCDVMCSGDGTLRKSADLWRLWNPRLGSSLHEMQISVAMRANALLAPKGRIVYSTCSINPVEDEAVVAEILRRSKGTLRLVDCAGKLKNFKYAPGVTQWNMCLRDGTIASREDIDGIQIRESMFPPTEEEAKWMNLHYGMRVLPHLQDSGGFFVAVLERVSEEDKMDTNGDEKKEQTKEASADETTTTKPEPNNGQGIVRQARGKTTGELEYSDIDTEFHNALVDFYDLNQDIFSYGTLFNRKDTKQLFREDVPKRIFYVPQPIRNILNFNEEAGRKWKIINVGLRIFEHAKRIVNTERKLSVEQYRVCQEGVDILYGNSTKRHLTIPYTIFAEVLKRREILITELEEWVQKNASGQEKEEAFITTIKEFAFGPCVAVDEKEFSPVAAHRSPYSLQVYCKKEMQSALLYNLTSAMEKK